VGASKQNQNVAPGEKSHLIVPTPPLFKRDNLDARSVTLQKASWEKNQEVRDTRRLDNFMRNGANESSKIEKKKFDGMRRHQDILERDRKGLRTKENADEDDENPDTNPIQSKKEDDYLAPLFGKLEISSENSVKSNMKTTKDRENSKSKTKASVRGNPFFGTKKKDRTTDKTKKNIVESLNELKISSGNSVKSNAKITKWKEDFESKTETPVRADTSLEMQKKSEMEIFKEKDSDMLTNSINELTNSINMTKNSVEKDSDVLTNSINELTNSIDMTGNPVEEGSNVPENSINELTNSINMTENPVEEGSNVPENSINELTNSIDMSKNPIEEDSNASKDSIEEDSDVPGNSTENNEKMTKEKEEDSEFETETPVREDTSLEAQKKSEMEFFKEEDSDVLTNLKEEDSDVLTNLKEEDSNVLTNLKEEDSNVSKDSIEEDSDVPGNSTENNEKITKEKEEKDVNFETETSAENDLSPKNEGISKTKRKRTDASLRKYELRRRNQLDSDQDVQILPSPNSTISRSYDSKNSTQRGSNKNKQVNKKNGGSAGAVSKSYYLRNRASDQDRHRTSSSNSHGNIENDPIVIEDSD
jgi:hypothetical protein